MPRGVYPRKRHKILADNRPASLPEAEVQMQQLNIKLLEREIEIARLNLLILKYRRALAKHGDFAEIQEELAS